jgi:hypothetical protein
MSIRDLPLPKHKRGITKKKCIAVYVYQIDIKTQILMKQSNI